MLEALFPGGFFEHLLKSFTRKAPPFRRLVCSKSISAPEKQSVTDTDNRDKDAPNNKTQDYSGHCQQITCSGQYKKNYCNEQREDEMQRSMKGNSPLNRSGGWRGVGFFADFQFPVLVSSRAPATPKPRQLCCILKRNLPAGKH